MRMKGQLVLPVNFAETQEIHGELSPNTFIVVFFFFPLCFQVEGEGKTLDSVPFSVESQCQ